MTEIAIRQPDALPAKIEYAKQLAYADMLPKQYQGKPANLLFAIEYADMLGLSPMAAVTGIHVIEGKPSASAALISALVRRAGHRLRVRVERDQSGLAAIAQIIRHDDPEWTFEARWDMARARTAGVANKPVWKSYPEAMLKARAITEVAREACEEALSGVSYTPEELGAEVDGDGSMVASAAPVSRVQAQPGSSVRAAASQAAPEPPGPAPSPETEDTPSSDAVPMITQAQTRKLGAVMREAGISGRDAALSAVSDVIGRQVASRNELTRDEAGRVIDALEQQHTAAQEQAADAPADDGEPVDAEVVEETPADVWRDLVHALPDGWLPDEMEAAFRRDHLGRAPWDCSLDELSAWGRRAISGAVRKPAKERKAADVGGGVESEEIPY